MSANPPAEHSVANQLTNVKALKQLNVQLAHSSLQSVRDQALLKLIELVSVHKVWFPSSENTPAAPSSNKLSKKERKEAQAA